MPDLAVIGDLGETLPALLPLIEDRRHQVWIQELKEWKSIRRKPTSSTTK